MKKQLAFIFCFVVINLFSLSTSATVIYFNDFEGAVGSEWSNTSTDITPIGSRSFLGQFSGNEDTILTLDNLPTHTEITVSFDLYIIRTWDGTGTMGGENWDLSIDGGAGLLGLDNGIFSNMENHGNDRQTYPDGDNPARTGAVENNTLGFIVQSYNNELMDSVYHLSFTDTHSASSLEVKFWGTGLQSNLLDGLYYDESWGLDNVIVTPEPATILLLGLGAVLLRNRRRKENR